MRKSFFPSLHPTYFHEIITVNNLVYSIWPVHLHRCVCVEVMCNFICTQFFENIMKHCSQLGSQETEITR